MHSSRGRRSACTTPQADSTKAFAAWEQIPNLEQKVERTRRNSRSVKNSTVLSRPGTLEPRPDIAETSATVSRLLLSSS